MKPRYFAWLGLLTALAALPAGAERRYILRAPAGTVATVAAKHGLGLVKVHGAGGQDIALVADYSDRAPQLLQQTVKSQAGAAGFELDSAVHVTERPSDARLEQSTVGILDALTRTDATTYYGDSVWSGYTTQPAGAIIALSDAQVRFASGWGTVAIIDTGVDPKHPALKGAVGWGYDFTRDQPGGSEMADVNQSTVGILDRRSVTVYRNVFAKVNQSTVAILDQSTVGILDQLNSLPAAFGHGTMVAGLVHYVAPTAKIMPLKAFNADGSGSLYDILRAIYTAVDRGAKVINMSFSMDGASVELEAAVQYAGAHGVICISSAGNSGVKTMVYPAGWAQVAGIGSTNLLDRQSTFSNYGQDLVSVAAPGENLITTYPGNNYAAVSGTSFSAALVSGTAALLAQMDFDITQTKASAALGQADPVKPADRKHDLGDGRINVFKACLFALLNSR